MTDALIADTNACGALGALLVLRAPSAHHSAGCQEAADDVQAVLCLMGRVLSKGVRSSAWGREVDVVAAKLVGDGAHGVMRAAAYVSAQLQ